MSQYQSTINDIYDLQRFAIKLGLDNITALSERLGDPHLHYPVIHVAGTNGKGSTCFFMQHTLRAMGLNVGLFTSPHLVDFRERIRINDEMISESFIIDFWSRIREYVLDRQATFFDVSAAMAFDYFSRKKVDVAIIETGLGGRLDSTNIVRPDTVVITPVHFDHEKQLGRNLSAIAAEKAGIFKDNADVFTAKQHRNVHATLERHLKEGSRLFKAEELYDITVQHAGLDGSRFSLNDALHSDFLESIQCKQAGDFQLRNLGLGYLAARHFLTKRDILFDTVAFRKRMASAYWPGRLQSVSLSPRIVFDVSHNYQGIKRSVSFYKSKGPVKSGRDTLLIGLVKDKDYRRIARFLKGRFNRIVITEPDTHRRLEGGHLLEAFKKLKQEAVFIKDLSEAYEFTKNELKKNDSLLVLGSHYLIGAYLSESN